MKGTLKKIIAVLVALILTGIASVGILMNQKGIINIFSNNVNEPLDLQVVNYDDHNYGTNNEPKYACVVINNSNFGNYSSNVSREGWLGEIFIGGSTSGYAGHYYWNATNDSGYCMDKSADLAGTAVVSNSLYVNKGSIYDRTTKSEEVQHKVEWLFDNFARVNIAYVSANESLENIPMQEEEFYKKNLADIIVKYGSKDSGEKYSMQEAESIISGIDNTGIFYVQQWAMWKYVSPGVKESGRVFKNNEERILYDTLLAGAEANGNYNSTGNEEVEIKKDSVVIEKRDNDIVLGPLKIENPTGKLFKLHYDGFSVNGKKIENSNIEVVRADKTTTISNDAYLSIGANGGEQIYVVIKNTNIDEKNKVYNFKGMINADSYSTMATYWESTIGKQPVVTLDRIPKSDLLSISTNYSEKEGDYTLSIKKIDDKGNAIDLQGNNIFTATVNSEALKVATINKETVTYDTVKISEDNLEKDIVSIIEHSGIEGYQKYNKKIDIEIEKTFSAELNKYIGSVGTVKINDEVAQKQQVSGGASYDGGNVIISWNDGNISVRIKNKNNKNYGFLLEKKNLDKTKDLEDVTFGLKKASKSETEISNWENVSLRSIMDGEFYSGLTNVIDNNKSDLYLIEEIQAPNGYAKLDKKFVVELVKGENEQGEFQIIKVCLYQFDLNEEIQLQKLTNTSSNFVEEKTERGILFVKDEDDTIFEMSVADLSSENVLFDITVYNKSVDLALRKMITQVADVDTNGDVVKTYDVARQTLPNISWVETESLKNSNNAVYRMNKKPVEVSVGQEVTYALMVFNEGEVGAKAIEITDYIPKGLTVKEVHYRNEASAMTQSNTPVNASNATENYYYYDRQNGVLSIALGFSYSIAPRAKTNDKINLSYDYVTVVCVVNEDAEGILTNVAEISKYKFLDEEQSRDIDSTANNWVAPTGNKLTADKAMDL